MSYTRPPFDGADATWLGASAYTRPAFDAADASFAPSPFTSTTPVLNVRAGSEWLRRYFKCWTGATWVPRRPKRWDGAQWL